MKFPLPEPAFAPVELTAAERAAMEALADRKLAEALAALDASEPAGPPAADRARWKLVKTREGVSVFRERRESARAAGAGRRLPRLLAVGSLPGELEDVMYGTMSPSAASVLVKADYCEDGVADAQVLLALRGPTLARPFQFLGLKWLVKRHPAGLDAIVLPRDLVYLETTGVVRRADGSRVGHFLMHSVDLPARCGCRARRDLGVVRGRISACYLFRERADAPGRVDVFMTAQVEPNGRVLDRAALASAASGLLRVRRAVLCAQHRKLAWRLRAARARPRPEAETDANAKTKTESETSALRCRVCARAVAGSAKTPRCEMCGARALCSRCVVSTSLTFATGRVTRREAVALCRPCVLAASRADAAAVAREEIRAGEYGSLESPRAAAPGEIRCPAREPKVRAEDAPLSTRSTELSLACLDELLLAADAPSDSGKCDRNYSHSDNHRDDDDSDDDWHDLLLDDDDEHDDNDDDAAYSTGGSSSSDASAMQWASSSSSSSSSVSSSASSTASATARGQQLWAQMSALRVAAEATYRLAKENTEQTLLLSASGRFAQ